MYYTVLSCNGEQGSPWKVEQCFSVKGRAKAYASNIQEPNPKSPTYNVVVKAHKKHLADLLIDETHVKFNDGTVAVWPMEVW